jgi:hypothetical protein
MSPNKPYAKKQAKARQRREKHHQARRSHSPVTHAHLRPSLFPCLSCTCHFVRLPAVIPRLLVRIGLLR